MCIPINEDIRQPFCLLFLGVFQDLKRVTTFRNRLSKTPIRPYKMVINFNFNKNNFVKLTRKLGVHFVLGVFLELIEGLDKGPGQPPAKNSVHSV